MSSLKTGVLAEPEFVGREKELEMLQSLLNSAIEGKGKTVFVLGEAGSGKTRLAREFLNAAIKRGVAVLAGWCLSDSQVPYFPFIEAFNSYYSSSQEQIDSLSRPGKPLSPSEPFQMITQERGISAWLTGAASTLKPAKTEFSSPQVWRDQLFAGVAKTLHNIASDEPVILLIEDLHWADSASLALLHYIARVVNNTERVLVLATFRSEELTADAEGHPHPLAETLRLMSREDLYTEVKLAGLDQANVSRIAENLVGGTIVPALREKLAGESRGNPLFVVESVRMLHELGDLREENGKWRLTSAELKIPSKIKNIILRRLACLKYSQRRVLDAASVIGEEFDVELLGIVLGQDYLEILETLNVVAHSTSLVCAEEDHYRFDHARSRETLYEELALPLKRGYHNKIAEKLESVKNETSRLSDIAYHYAQAGKKEKAIKYALAAGQDALVRWGNVEAIKNFSYVVEETGNDPEHIQERLIALEGLGDAFYARSMFNEAIRVFENLSTLAANELVRLRSFRKAMEAIFQYGDMPHLIELVKKAEPYAVADRLEYARILGSKARSSTMQGMGSAAFEFWQEALKVFEEEYSLWDIAWALVGMGSMHALLATKNDEAKQGLAESLCSIALFEDLKDFRWQMEASFGAGLVCHMCLLDNIAMEMFQRVIDVNERVKMGDYLRLVYANVDKARSFWSSRDFSQALFYTLRALEASDKTDSAVAHGMVYSNLTIEYAMLGDNMNSEQYFAKLVKLPPEILAHVFVHAGPAEAVFLAAKSKWKESNQAFEKVVAFNEQIAPPFAFRMKLLYAWALEKQGRYEEAKTLYEEVQRVHRNAAESFAHPFVQARLLGRRQVEVGEEFEMRLDLVNVSRKPGLLVKAEGLLPSLGFKVTSLSPWCRQQDGIIEMKNREIGAFQVETLKLTLQAAMAGTFTLNPKVIYVDDLGRTKTSNINTLAVTVQPTIHVLPGRISSGFDELDDLLGGGIPENYAVVLVSPSSDERSLLVKSFLEAGARAGETTLYLTTEVGATKILAETYESEFSVLICNPQAGAMIENLPNVNNLKGVENLTEIDIALAKYFRTLNPAKPGQRRACIQIVSDVLLQHHVVTTRRWLSALLPNLKSKGFTTLAVVDPSMHAPEATQAIVSLFEGEISIAEKVSVMGLEKVLKILKLYNQRYSEAELVLTKKKLQSI